MTAYRRFGLRLSSAVTVLASAALFSISTAAAAQTGAIRGVVRGGLTGEPLGGAAVLLQGTPLSATTDQYGEFAIRGLAQGRYTLQVLAIGFSGDSLVEIELEEGEEREVTVTLFPVALRLHEFVVTASRTAERSEESIASIAALPQEQILLRNVVKIDEALDFVPGVTRQGEDQLDIRGAAGMARGIGSRVLVLLDGHPILTGDGGEINFSAVPMLDLDRAEVVKGAYSAAYGSNALGGVVQLLTKRIDSVPESVFRAYLGTYNHQQQHQWSSARQGTVGLGLQHSRRLGSVGARVALGYEGTNGFSENGESTRWHGRFKLTSGSERNAPWDVYGMFLRERSGEFFVWRSADEPYLVPPTAAGDHTIEYTVLSGASVTPLVSARTLLRLSSYVNFNRTENYFDDNDDWHDAFKPGVQGQFSWYVGPHALTIGADGSYTWVRSNFLGHPNILDVAAFVQDEVAVSSTLRGTFGVRLDYHHAKTASAEWALNPKIGVAWRPAARATVRASVGAGYRAPSAIEQFVSSRQFGFTVVPNPDLQGERALSGEVGTTVTLVDRVRVDAAAFGSLYRDLIGPGPVAGRPFVFQFQNIARARVAGIDLGVDAQVLPEKLELQVGYLLLGTEDLDGGDALPYRSRHNLTGTLAAFRGLAAVDVRYRSKVEEVLAYPLDQRSDVTVVDLRFAYPLLNGLWQLKLANLFNKFFVDVQERNPGAPRSIMLTAVYGM